MSRLPVRVKADFMAPVPAYWQEISSPWSAHITRNSTSTCQQRRGVGWLNI